VSYSQTYLTSSHRSQPNLCATHKPTSQFHTHADTTVVSYLQTYLTSSHTSQPAGKKVSVLVSLCLSLRLVKVRVDCAYYSYECAYKMLAAL